MESIDPDLVKFLKKKTIRTELSYTGETLSYGFLVKDLDDYEFLVDFVRDNNNVLNTCNTLLINNLSNEAQDEQTTDSIFSAESSAFWTTFGILLTTIVTIAFFGCCYEIRRRKKERRKSLPKLLNKPYTAPS